VSIEHNTTLKLLGPLHIVLAFSAIHPRMLNQSKMP